MRAGTSTARITMSHCIGSRSGRPITGSSTLCSTRASGAHIFSSSATTFSTVCHFGSVRALRDFRVLAIRSSNFACSPVSLDRSTCRAAQLYERSAACQDLRKGFVARPDAKTAASAIGGTLLRGSRRPRARWLVLLLAVQLLRVWVLLLLGSRWNTRGTVPRSLAVQTRGPGRETVPLRICEQALGEAESVASWTPSPEF
jgi:hypothetical protein